MLSMVYVSSATRPLTDDDLRQILHAAQKSNERAGLTGLLLYKDGNFMQAIEGPDDPLNEVFLRICRDVRHHGVIVLLKEQIQERRFADWSMSLKKIERLQAPPAASVSNFIDDDLTAAKFREEPTKAVKLLLSFRDSMR